MNSFSRNNEVSVKLNNIFINRFGIDLLNNKSNININLNLLGSKFKLRARDLIYLLYDVENEFNIVISEEDIDNIKFNTINNIIYCINKALQQKENGVI